jgi:hypothetical protein
MRDLVSDWKWWSAGERVGAIAIVITCFVIAGASILETLPS